MSATYHCPFPGCDWTIEEPATPRVPPVLADAFGMSPAALGGVHLDQMTRRMEGDVRDHLRTHPGEDWAQSYATLGRQDAPECQLCGAKRSPGTPDYDPVALITAGRIGWYSGDDGEMCPTCMAEAMGR